MLRVRNAPDLSVAAVRRQTRKKIHPVGAPQRAYWNFMCIVSNMGEFSLGRIFGRGLAAAPGDRPRRQGLFTSSHYDTMKLR